jgi:hypothetical protein
MAESYYEEVSERAEHNKLDHTSGDLDYIGMHLHKAATTDVNWKIWKFTWSAGKLTNIEGPLTGTWDGRASLSWG